MLRSKNLFLSVVANNNCQRQENHTEKSFSVSLSRREERKFSSIPTCFGVGVTWVRVEGKILLGKEEGKTSSIPLHDARTQMKSSGLASFFFLEHFFSENAIEAFKGFAPFCEDKKKEIKGMGRKSGDDDDEVEDEVKRKSDFMKYSYREDCCWLVKLVINCLVVEKGQGENISV